MKAEQLYSLANDLYIRISESRGLVGVYYDSTGFFRISPVKGVSYKRVEEDFPNSIVGAYTSSVEFDDFYEDFEDFCRLLGVLL